MTLIITWEFLRKNFVVGIFGVWIFGLLQIKPGWIDSTTRNLDQFARDKVNYKLFGTEGLVNIVIFIDY